ncbi:MAG TPA: ABC transporter permease, partial [Solirubrobacterales bacterium]|nr:ABC transporter permease [Solirubrobacterales bacterium]
LGRDEMVRLMYGGRASLFVGFASALLATVLATILALLAGYYRGWVDTVISRALDVIWAFPVLLLGIALGIALALGGLKIGPVEIPSGSIWITVLIIGGVLVPYTARPLRGTVLALREKEFVEASVAQGAGPLRVMFGELLPNLASTIIVFFTLAVANAMLFEAALSFLGVGVQPPDTSWGAMVGDSFDLLSSSPLLTILPGTMIFLTVLSVNVLGDGLRDALDPRSKVRLEAHAGIAEPEGTAV